MFNWNNKRHCNKRWHNWWQLGHQLANLYSSDMWYVFDMIFKSWKQDATMVNDDFLLLAWMVWCEDIWTGPPTPTWFSSETFRFRSKHAQIFSSFLDLIHVYGVWCRSKETTCLILVFAFRKRLKNEILEQWNESKVPSLLYIPDFIQKLWRF